MEERDLVNSVMDFRETALSAGRAVLDMMERESQPLSDRELEHRLDQVVEEILEADLVAKLETETSPTFSLHLLQGQEITNTQSLKKGLAKAKKEDTRSHKSFGDWDDATVTYISDLLQSSKSRARMAGRARLSVRQTVLLSLSLLSERVSYRLVSRHFKLEKGNIHRIFFSFCESINKLQEKHIRWPVGKEAEDTLFPFFDMLETEGQVVPRVLGVLGHTRIPIRLSVGRSHMRSTGPAVKRMKGEANLDSWLNLELLCSSGGHFLHYRISKKFDQERGKFLINRLKEQPELMPKDTCIIARANYPLTTHILTPYTGKCGPKEELFNKILEQHFQIFDQAVASLKTRFKRLQHLDIGNYDRARAMVLTACVLHNVFVSRGQVVQGGIVEAEPLLQGEKAEEDEGVQKRNSIADALFGNVGLGNT